MVEEIVLEEGIKSYINKNVDRISNIEIKLGDELHPLVRHKIKNWDDNDSLKAIPISYLKEIGMYSIFPTPYKNFIAYIHYDDL